MNLIGKTLGQYQIVERIGQGGMATVFKAYQSALDRHVALKLLPVQHALITPGFSERFEREARAVAQLDHPNILPVMEFGQEGDLSYIVMKLVTGGTLKERLGRSLDLAQASPFVEQIAAALDHAHGRGIIHRDVKPSNVLLNENDWAQLADFGLAKMVGGDARLTASGASLGTPAYMSPEQAQGLELDHRTDVYSLGVILYEMATGQPPFRAATPLATILQHISASPPPPHELNPATPLAVEGVILKALEKEPANRHASAGEMARAFQEAMSGPAGATPIIAPREPAAVFPPASPTPAPQALGREQLSKLRRILDHRFDEEGLRTLCFDLGVDYEGLPAKGKVGKARELVAHLERHDHIPELIELGQRMRPDISWDFAIVAVSQKSELTLPPEPTRPPQVEFVGREKELAYFAGKLETLHLVVITGMAGVGKTALAATLARQVAEPEQIFWHAFHEGEGVDTLLWKLAGFLAWRRQDDVWRMLQVAQQSGSQPPPIEVLFDYLFQLLRDKGYVLCLDEFQFVDQDPLLIQLVERLREVVEAGGLSFIITSHRVPDFVRTVEFETLSGLSADDTDSLLAAQGVTLSENLASDLYTHTEGNAELLTLALDALKRAAKPAHLIARLAEAENIERYLMNEVDDGLSEDERDVMSAVALLLGYTGTRDAIETALDGGSARRTLSSLSQRNLLTVSQGEWGKEYGQHALVRAFYYDLLGRRQRRDMHRRAGEFYESEEPDTLKAARHYERGGEYERAAELATADVWALINQGQARALRRTLERFKARWLEPTLWAKVNIARGQVYTFLRTSEPARQSFQEALSTLATLPDQPAIQKLKARTCRGMGDLLEFEAPPEALDWLHRGLEELGPADRKEEAALYIHIASVHTAMGNLDAALETVQKGLDLLPQDPSHMRASASMSLGTIHSLRGDIEKGSQYTLQALEIARQLHDHFRMATIWYNLGFDRFDLNDWADAATNFQQALKLAEQLGDISRQANTENMLGMLHTNLGDYELASNYLSHAHTLARDKNLRGDLPYILNSLADLQLRQGAWDDAETALTEAERLAVEMETKYPLVDLYAYRAQVHLGQGKLDAALEMAERSVALAREMELRAEQGSSLRVLGQALCARGQVEDALETFGKSLALLANTPYAAARTNMQWGLALTSDGDTEQGTLLLEQARDTFRSLGARRDETAVERAL